MALFQSSALKDHLRLQDVQRIEKLYFRLSSIKSHNIEKKDASGGVTSSGVEMPPLTKKGEFEWMELFEENKKKALELQREIEKTDREIDGMVYELYGLTKDIGIVENS